MILSRNVYSRRGNEGLSSQTYQSSGSLPGSSPKWHLGVRGKRWAKEEKEIKHNRTHSDQHIAFRTTGLIGGQVHVENLQMRWPWRNLGTITPWLVSTAAQDSESFCVSLHFKLAITFLTFAVSSLCSSVLPHSSKGGKSNIYTFWSNQRKS